MVKENLFADFFGHEVHVADRIARLPQMVLKHAAERPDGQWQVELTPLIGARDKTIVELHPPGQGDAAIG